MPKTLDLEKLRAQCVAVDKFRAFEREVEGAILRELGGRREDAEERKRSREKRAKKKRIKTAAAA